MITRLSYLQVDTDPFRPDAKRGAMRRLTPGGKEVFDNQKSFFLHCFLPYGRWTCADGREVLFNRYYEPTWERTGRSAKRADPKEWVPWEKQDYFFNGHNAPWHNAETLRKCAAILCEFVCHNLRVADELEPILRYTDVTDVLRATSRALASLSMGYHASEFQGVMTTCTTTVNPPRRAGRQCKFVR